MEFPFLPVHYFDKSRVGILSWSLILSELQTSTLYGPKDLKETYSDAAMVFHGSSYLGMILNNVPSAYLPFFKYNFEGW